MPYMREFFHEKLQLPIEFFNPLRNVAVAETVKTAEVANSAHLFGELVGLALRNATTCPMELNLRPASVVKRQELERRRPLFHARRGLFRSRLARLGLLLRARGQRGAAAAKDRLRRKWNRCGTLEGLMNNVRKETTALDGAATPLVAAINDRSFWPRDYRRAQCAAAKGRHLDHGIGRRPPEGKPIGVGDTEIGARGSDADCRRRRPRRRRVPEPTPAEPAIDGILVRGLYLFNPKQQEVVVDYFRNLVGSPYFNVDPNNQAKAITPDARRTTRSGPSLRTAPRIEEAGETCHELVPAKSISGHVPRHLRRGHAGGALFFLQRARAVSMTRGRSSIKTPRS